MKCIYCNYLINKADNFCKSCGNCLKKAAVICTSCKTVLPGTAKFCRLCGHKVEKDSKPMIVVDGEKNLICQICFTEIDSGLTFCPACRESFHYKHLINWVKMEKNNTTCPHCRKKLKLIYNNENG